MSREDDVKYIKGALSKYSCTAKLTPEDEEKIGLILTDHNREYAFDRVSEQFHMLREIFQQRKKLLINADCVSSNLLTALGELK